MNDNRFPTPTDSMIGESNPSLTLTDAQERNIETLCQIAKQNGTSLSLKEAIDLASLHIPEEDLANAWNRSSVLSSRFLVDSGQIMETFSSLAEEEITMRRIRAEWNLEVGRNFALLFRSDENLLLLSISGSTSYHSVSKEDDLDFFCVTRNDSMWIFLLKALIKGRLFRAREKRSPPFCFSYVMEEAYARKLFSKRSDALFARDAMMAVVLKGEEFYGKLLTENEWIGSYFPRMYSTRISEVLKRHYSESMVGEFSKKPPTSQRIANRILWPILGNYIRVKSYLLNRKFSRVEDTRRIFKVKMDKDHCLFESNDYMELRRKYTGFQILQ